MALFKVEIAYVKAAKCPVFEMTVEAESAAEAEKKATAFAKGSGFNSEIKDYRTREID